MLREIFYNTRLSAGVVFGVYTLAMKAFALILFALIAFSGGQTAQAESPQACIELWAPVCGAKQVQCVRAPCNPVPTTYSNSCFMGVDKATFIHEGECTGDETGGGSGGENYTPPAGCMAWYDGCNSCSRATKDGPAMCTLMACQGTPQAGYCRSYAVPAPPIDGDTPVSSPPGGTVSSPPASPDEVPPVATGTSPESAIVQSFLSQIWSYISSWFSYVF